MNVTKMTPNNPMMKEEVLPPTDEQLKSELDFIRAKKCSQELLERGLVTQKQ